MLRREWDGAVGESGSGQEQLYRAGEGDGAGDVGRGFAIEELIGSEGDGLGGEGGGASPAVEAR